MLFFLKSDEYGFVNKFACSRETYLSFRDRYRGSKEKMEKTWKKLVKLQPISILSRNSTPPPLLNSSSSISNTFEYKFEPFNPASKKALRQGIPSNLRPMAWYFYSGGEALRARHPNPSAFYESLLLQPKPSAFFLLTDRMKMDFRDILPTNELVRRDYFSATNTMINEVPDVGRVRIIPDRVESPHENRPRRMTIFDRNLKGSVGPDVAAVVSTGNSGTIPFMSRLYNVLVAFLLFRPRVEYCRAVCSIASILLLVIQDEEKTFWTLSSLFSNYAGAEESFETPTEEVIHFHDFRNDSSTSLTQSLSSLSSRNNTSDSSLNSCGFKYFPDDMFRDTSTCSYAALDGFKAILCKKKPALSLQMENFDIPVSLLATTWFQSIFIDVLPTESSMRVLDAFIGEGFKVLYRVALALFYINESDLMQKFKTKASNSSSSSSNNLFGSFLSRSASPVGNEKSVSNPQAVLNSIKFMPKKQIDADVLLDFAFNRIGSLPMSLIQSECKRAAQAERPLQSIRRFSQTAETKLSIETIRRVSSTGR